MVMVVNSESKLNNTPDSLSMHSETGSITNTCDITKWIKG